MPEPPPLPSASAGTFSSLRIPDFRYLWLGQLSHAGALWMEQLARPFLIFEMVDENKAVHLGAVLAVRTVPQLLFGVWAGVLTDRLDRRRILLLDKIGVLTINIAFAVLLLGGWLELWHLYAYAFVRGSMMAFDQPARVSMIPSIVPANRVTNAVALMSVTQNSMRIFGAALGGISYAVFGAEGTFVAISVIYTGAVYFTIGCECPRARDEGEQQLSLVESLAEGARFAFGHPAIRGVLILSLIYFIFGMSYLQVFIPLFAEEVFDIGSSGAGLILALTGVTALFATLYIARQQPERLGLVLPGLVIVFGGMLVLFSLTTYLPGAAGLLLPIAVISLVGAVQTSYLSLSRAMILHTTPERLRGRVISLITMDRAFFTAGGAAAGILANWQGPQVAQIVYGAVCLMGGVAILALARDFRRSRAFAPRDEPERPSEAPEPTAARPAPGRAESEA